MTNKCIPRKIFQISEKNKLYCELVMPFIIKNLEDNIKKL